MGAITPLIHLKLISHRLWQIRCENRQKRRGRWDFSRMTLPCKLESGQPFAKCIRGGIKCPLNQVTGYGYRGPAPPPPLFVQGCSNLQKFEPKVAPSSELRIIDGVTVAHFVKGCCCYRKLKTDHGCMHPRNSYAPLNLSQRTIRGLRPRKISQKSHAVYNGPSSKISPENDQIVSR